MLPPRDPDEVEQTLLPGASAAPPPPRGAPARPARPDPADADTPSTPGAADATLETPVPAAAADPGDTLPSGARPAPAPAHNGEAGEGVEATLLPSSVHTANGTPATLGGADATGTGASELGATLPTPVGRTVVSGSGSRGPLGGDTGPMSGSTAGAAPGASPSATGTMIGRFALKGLHASGGLGEVFTARDTELNREVAVKRIKSRYADDAGSRRRFLTEAELTAKLDHPGVVPVFGLVNDVRGRPCYAMRFIRGETLKDEIDRYHGNRKTEDRGQKTEKADGDDKPAEAKPAEAFTPACAGVPRSVAFRHLLARFIATCQAVAYAHKKNIIHRDIKPANIMVGAFGETLVVDWGLAKSLDDGPDLDHVMKAAAEAGFRNDPEATDLPSHMTTAGTAVGTPSYMAPEQATGELDKVGPRSDIYALGATLFVILTGKTPVSGKTTAEVLDSVRRGAYEPAAAVNPEAPKPLDAVCRKAMALRPEDRYATALDLAADVERWLSDEPVSCYRDPPLARLARWTRRHPARVAAAASLLLAGVIGAAGVAWAVNEGRKNTKDALTKVTEEEEKKTEALRKLGIEQQTTLRVNEKLKDQTAATENARVEAVGARNVARGRYEAAVAAYNVFVRDMDRKMADSPGQQKLRESLLNDSIKGLQGLLDSGGGPAAADRTLVAAYRQTGEVYQLLGKTGEAEEKFDKAVKTARAVKEAADRTPRTPVADKREADRDYARSLEKLAGAYLQAGKSKDALEKIEEALGYFAKLAEEAGDVAAQKDRAGAKALRAKVLADLGRTGRAVTDCEEARDERDRLAAAAPGDLDRKRDLAESLDALAELQLRTARTKDALTSAEESLKVRTAIATTLPGRPAVRRELAAAYARLGDVHVARGRVAAAAKWYGDGLGVLTAIPAEERDQNVGVRADLALLHGRLANALLRTGDIDAAEASAEEGVKVAGALHAADPTFAKARRDLALARERYGDTLLAAGKTDAGIVEYTGSRALFGRLRDEDRESARAKYDLARAMERMGDGRMAKKDMTGAADMYAESLRERQDPGGRDTASAGAKRELAVSLYKLAEAYCGKGEPGRAEEIAASATEMFAQLAELDPESGQALRDTALAYGKWGQVLAAAGHTTGALIVSLGSLDRCKQLADRDAENAQAKEDEAAAWERLAALYAAVSNRRKALAAAGAAAERWKEVAARTAGAKTKYGRRRLALALVRCGDLSAELEQFADASTLYDQAAAETQGFESDKFLKEVADKVAEQRKYAAAVSAGLKNPVSVRTLPDCPDRVRVAALRTVAVIELRAERPENAGEAASRLADLATEKDDIFAAANAFAGAAASPKVKESAVPGHATAAVRELRRAIAQGFHDADALATPEWEVVRAHLPKEFDAARAELEKAKAAGK
jgi:serine/threonine protein kinase